MSKVLFSSVAGFVIALLLSVTPNVDAACQGYCADLYPGGGVFAGCSLHLDQYGQVVGVDCFYSFPTSPDPQDPPDRDDRPIGTPCRDGLCRD